MERIWSEIQKPDNLALIWFEEIFKTEVIPLRNYYYEREAFKEDICSLKKMLTDSEN